jgi:hypothetical protein
MVRCREDPVDSTCCLGVCVTRVRLEFCHRRPKAVELALMVIPEMDRMRDGSTPHKPQERWQ